MTDYESSNHDGPIRIALPSKGHLFEGIVEILKTAGYKVKRASDRQYEATIAGHPRFHVVFMRPSDIVTQVDEGRCQLGVTGMDVYAERAAEAERSCVVSEDLGYGGCRLVVAVPESWVDVTHMLDLVDLAAEFKAVGKSLRISTKYPTLAKEHLRRWGVHDFRLIESDGALELQPLLDIADLIVDLTSSGATLKDNRLREIEGGTVRDSSACLIGHAPGLRLLIAEGESSPLAILLDAIDAVRVSEGLLHLEVVGEAGEQGASAAAADLLREHGARHIVHGTVWTDDGRPGWRVTALVKDRELAALKRPLVRLGASRLVGLPPRSVFDRDQSSTYDQLVEQLSN